MKNCTYCEQPLLTPLVCLACGALLELEKGVDPSPFEILGLKEDWNVEEEDLKRQLLLLTRAVHPDFYATADETTRQRAESASAALNAAHQTLEGDVRRADWLIRSLGGPSDSDERQMPQEFLIEVLEWNEVLERGADCARGSAEWTGLEQLEAELGTQRQRCLATISRHLTPLPEHGDPILGEVRRELNAVRYIDRAREQLENIQLKTSLGHHG